MGYYMSVRALNVFIDRKYHREALRAIQKMVPGLGNSVDYVNGAFSYHFHGVDESDVEKAETLEDALIAWRWNPEFNKNDDIDYLEFYGQKLGDDYQLFQALAPFIKEGSSIEMIGEDQEMWRWYFDGKECIEQGVKEIVWG